MSIYDEIYGGEAGTGYAGLGGGYDAGNETWDQYIERITTGVVPTRYVIRTWYPAQPAIPGVAGVAPTPTQINYLMNAAWNSWAVSVEPIPPGSYIEYMVSSGITGAIVALGRVEQSGKRYNTFQHGILIDLSGVWVYEMGAKGTLLMTISKLASTKVRIYRQEDNSVVYVVINTNGTVLYKSTVAAMQLPLHGHGYLYSSGDTLTTTAIAEGQVQFGSV